MRIILKNLPRDHKIAIMSCSHQGARGRDSGAYNEAIMQVKGNGYYAVHLGDFVDGITVRDKRYSREEDQGDTILRQYVDAERNLEPIQDRLLVLLEGNHDRKLNQFGNFVREMAYDLKVEYGTYSCVLVICDEESGAPMYKIFATHGYGSFSSNADDPLRRRANLKLSLKRKLKDKMTDCELMAMGHTHRLLVVPPTEWLRLYTDLSRPLGRQIRSFYKPPMNDRFIHPDNRWYVNAGSFYRLYADGTSNYAEVAGYDPLDVGYALVNVEDGMIQNVQEVIL